MTQYLTENFIDLSNRRLGANRGTELGFNHAESRLNVRPLVVVRQESLLVEIVEVPHLSPQAVKLLASLSAFGIAFEGNVRR